MKNEIFTSLKKEQGQKKLWALVVRIDHLAKTLKCLKRIHKDDWNGNPELSGAARHFRANWDAIYHLSILKRWKVTENTSKNRNFLVNLENLKGNWRFWRSRNPKNMTIYRWDRLTKLEKEKKRCHWHWLIYQSRIDPPRRWRLTNDGEQCQPISLHDHRPHMDLSTSSSLKK